MVTWVRGGAMHSAEDGAGYQAVAYREPAPAGGC